MQLVRKHYGQSIEETCREFGLTRAEMDVLLFLASNPETDRAVDIVELRGLTKSHVSVAVKSLCDRGLLNTRQDEQDRRAVHLIPTEAAKPIIAKGQENQRRYLMGMFQDFSEDELQQWVALQEKIFANLRKMN